MIQQLLLFLSTLICFCSASLDANPPRKPIIYERALLITGCARSGTGYISALLKDAGFPIDHERVGKEGVSAWTAAVPAEKAPWGPSPNCMIFDHIFHQVRHPLKVISSVYTSEPKLSWTYIISHVPAISWDDPHLVKCAKYWYYWNLIAGEKAEWTYRIEDVPHLLGEFETRLGITLDHTALDRVPKNINIRRGARKFFTWADLKSELDSDLYDNIRALAEYYGYSTKDEV